jgi:hypothetical protein
MNNKYAGIFNLQAIDGLAKGSYRLFCPMIGQEHQGYTPPLPMIQILV